MCAVFRLWGRQTCASHPMRADPRVGTLVESVTALLGWNNLKPETGQSIVLQHLLYA